ncbi:MAG: FKBP-type peptidyl-prolyl cis-trans isomerase [Bacteroidetes bacterium]|nr:FKBP-type peptidyl-prolyl cis-trans isomerase [Bacteroidota bacterium]
MLCLSALIACNGQKGKNSLDLKSKADSVAYAIGTSIGGSMKKDGLDSLNLDILKQGLNAALRGDSLLLDQMKSQSVIQSYLQERQKSKDAVNIEKGKKFLEENKKKPGVTELPDGLQYLVLKDGTGAIPTATDTVIVHYHGTLIDGSVFDSSIDRGEPATFAVTGQVIKGWEEALQLMKVGSKWKVFIPASLAWGDRAAGPKIPANSTVIFEMELISIKAK